MIPQEVQTVLRTLEQAGHKAYVVGGCVRDMQMGLPPHDWDVTTSALPEETMALFPHFAIPTGLQHGTVPVRSGGVSCEVTTFRTDGDYPDHRHPAAVTFTRSLREDLARRDLAVNAAFCGRCGFPPRWALPLSRRPTGRCGHSAATYGTWRRSVSGRN